MPFLLHTTFDFPCAQMFVIKIIKLYLQSDDSFKFISSKRDLVIMFFFFFAFIHVINLVFVVAGAYDMGYWWLSFVCIHFLFFHFPSYKFTVRR